MALITLIDSDRQWFKSHPGVPMTQTPRDISFCAHAIADREDVMVVPNLSEDPRFADNPLVAAEPRVRFYAGCPLRSLDGYRLGTLCVIDLKPRQPDPDQIRTLQDLAAIAELELNRGEIGRAVTLLRESEAELHHQKETMVAVLESVSEGLVVADPQGQVVLLNPAAARLLGTEAIGLPLSEWPQRLGLFQGEHSSETAYAELPLLAAITGFEIGERELRLHRTSGPDLWLAAAAKPLRDRQGLLRGGVMVLRDVSQRREVQRLRQEYIHNVSHELRTPISAVCFALQPLLENAEGLGGVQARALLRAAHSGANHAFRMTEDLIEAARAEAGGIKVSPRRQRAGPLLAEIAGMMRPSAESKSIGLEFQQPRGIPEVNCDPARLRQILVNLLGNAIKFTPSGGTVRLSAHPTPDRSGLQVTVSDTGCGVDSALGQLIFERGAPPRRPEHGGERGLGLGLVLCRELVRGHGGRIWHEATSGGGATFHFIIPAAETAPQTRARTARSRRR